MAKSEADAKKVFEAFQETIHFHFTKINSLFDNCELTLVARSVKDDKVVCVYSEEPDLERLFDLAKKSVQDNPVKPKME